MKILHVLPTLSAGGAESFVTHLGVSLAASSAEVKFYLLAGARGERGQVLLQRLQKSGIEVVGHEERNIRSPSTILQLAGLIRSWQPDIIQANLYSAEVVTVLASLLGKGRSTHLVRRLAGTDIVGHRSKRMVRFIGRRFSHTICCSQAVQRAHVDLAGRASAAKSSTIVNGAYAPDNKRDHQARTRFRNDLGIPADAFVFCHVGRMMGNGPGTGLETEPKAQDVLLKSFGRAFKGQGAKRLILVGGGRLQPEAQALAVSLGVGNQVHFLGIQPEPWPALHAADAFVFPSRHEGMPNALVEAALCDLPALASDIPEIRSISPGDAWLLKPVDDVDAFADGLKTIVDQYDLFLARAKQAAPRMRESFSMATCARSYSELYRSLL